MSIDSMITSIQIHEKVKKELDTLKEIDKESYEEVIARLIETVEKQRRVRKELLIEGYKEMSEHSLMVSKEWANADKDWD